MIEAPVNEAKTKLTELLRAVEAGERVVITRHGKPVAELVPPMPAPKNTFSFEAIDAALRARGIEPRTIPVPDDLDEPLPEEFWFPPDDILTDPKP
ncbi:MAG: type II toxin-antitoxin system prevent-host-death family antitoxin [Caulobacterales bacterium]